MFEASKAELVTQGSRTPSLGLLWVFSATLWSFALKTLGWTSEWGAENLCLNWCSPGAHMTDVRKPDCSSLSGDPHHLGTPPLPCATSSKISPWFPLPWAAFYPISLHYKTLCFSLDCRLPEGMTVLIRVSVPRLDPGKLPTHMKRSWKNGWMDDFCTVWRTQLSEIFLRKIIPLHTPMQSLSSTWTISEWTRDKDDKAHLLGRTRKNYKKSESSYSVSDSEPRRVPICSIGKIWFCLFFFFFFLRN